MNGHYMMVPEDKNVPCIHISGSISKGVWENALTEQRILTGKTGFLTLFRVKAHHGSKKVGVTGKRGSRQALQSCKESRGRHYDTVYLGPSPPSGQTQVMFP